MSDQNPDPKPNPDHLVIHVWVYELPSQEHYYATTPHGEKCAETKNTDLKKIAETVYRKVWHHLYGDGSEPGRSIFIDFTPPHGMTHTSGCHPTLNHKMSLTRIYEFFRYYNEAIAGR